MSVESVWDAIAARAKTIAGVEAAYGSGLADPTVEPPPDDIPTGPTAVVDYLGSTVSHGAFEETRSRYAIDLWHPKGNAGRAASIVFLAPLFERFRASFDAATAMGGSLQVLIVTAGPFADDTWADTEKEYVVQQLVAEAIETRNVTHQTGG